MGAREKLVGNFFEARASANAAIRRLEQMPLVLRITCLASLGAGVVLLILCIVQIGSIRINNDTLSWVEVRAAGYYPFLIICALAMVGGGVGIWMRRGWSRWLVVLLYIYTSPIGIIYWRSHADDESALPWEYCISAAVWAGFYYWYLFHRQKKAFDVSENLGVR